MKNNFIYTLGKSIITLGQTIVTFTENRKRKEIEKILTRLGELGVDKSTIDSIYNDVPTIPTKEEKEEKEIIIKENIEEVIDRTDVVELPVKPEQKEECIEEKEIETTESTINVESEETTSYTETTYPKWGNIIKTMSKNKKLPCVSGKSIVDGVKRPSSKKDRFEYLDQILNGNCRNILQLGNLLDRERDGESGRVHSGYGSCPTLTTGSRVTVIVTK